MTISSCRLKYCCSLSNLIGSYKMICNMESFRFYCIMKGSKVCSVWSTKPMTQVINPQEEFILHYFCSVLSFCCTVKLRFCNFQNRLLHTTYYILHIVSTTYCTYWSVRVRVGCLLTGRLVVGSSAPLVACQSVFGQDMNPKLLPMAASLAYECLREFLMALWALPSSV